MAIAASFSAKELGKLWSEANKLTELLDIAKKGEN